MVQNILALLKNLLNDDLLIKISGLLAMSIFQTSSLPLNKGLLQVCMPRSN